MSTVPLRGLRAIAVVAETGSIARAAQALHLSTAAVTRAVQGAEADLQLALFERAPRGMVPTEAGRCFATRAARAMQALELGAQGLRARGAPAPVAALPRLAVDSMLRAIVARAEHPSEAAAAASLGVSQPSLHEALRKLEHLARMPLFERVRGGARLNEAGEWLLQQVKVALAEIRVGHDELARGQGRGRSTVAIGTLPMASDVIVPQAVAQALALPLAPGVVVKDGTYESLTRLLRLADVDMMVGPLRGSGCAADLVEETLYVDRFVAVVRRGHPALREGQRLALRRLAPYPWIGPLAGTPAHAAFDRLFDAAGLARPVVTLRTHSSAVLRSVLLVSDHVALVSPLQVHADVQAGSLAWASAPLAGSERAIGITQRRDALASSACADLLALLRRVTADALATLKR